MTDSPLAVIPKEVWIKFYDDAIAPSAKQFGNISAGLLQASTYLLNPMIRAMIESRERLTRDLESVCSSVPAAQQVEVKPEIAGPVFERLRYLEDSNELRALYLNLLKSAIDSERQANVHPGFVKVLENISAQDALMFWHIHRACQLERTAIIELPPGSHNPIEKLTFRALNHAPWFVEALSPVGNIRLRTSVELLESLALIRIVGGTTISSEHIQYRCELTSFGRMFLETCLPDVFE